MSERRFKELTPETMTPEQKKAADAIQAGPRGAGLRGPFNALLRAPELCDLVQRVAQVRAAQQRVERTAQPGATRARLDRIGRLLLLGRHRLGRQFLEASFGHISSPPSIYGDARIREALGQALLKVPFVVHRK